MRDSIVINGRELVRKNMTSLGYIICIVAPMLAKNFNVTILIPRGNLHPRAAETLQVNGLKIIHLKSDCSGIKGRLFYYYCLYKFIYTKKPSIFWEINHAILPTPSSTNGCVTIHDIYPLIPELNPSRFKKIIFKASIWLSLKSANTIMMPSLTTKMDVISKFDFDESKAFVVSNGVYEQSSFVELKNSKPIKIDDTISLGYIGRLNRWKGIDRLVDYFISSHLNISLKVAGALDPSISRHIVSASNRPGFEYLGQVDESSKRDLFNSISAFIYPTRYDGFGIPPLEAMFYRVPVIASDIPIMREVLGDNAIYLDLNAPNPLDNALSELASFSDDAQRERLDLAQKHAFCYSWEGYVDQMCAAINSRRTHK